MARKITLSEALSWAKTLASRRAELVQLRNQNARVVQQRASYAATEGVTVQEPTYDAKALDRTIALIAREERLLDAAIKRMNARVVVEEYEQDDAVLGELV